MAKRLVGYMITWTTYGTWLQGDKRGYVKDGRILEGNQKLFELCKGLQKSQTVKLTKPEKEIVRQAISNESQRIRQKIEAMAVCTNHLHLATRPCDKSIERTVSMYKSAATRALRTGGRSGPIWTTGFDKRFCFTEADLAREIEYIQNHND
jgi:REP element-mobilizing transposase RayT